MLRLVRLLTKCHATMRNGRSAASRVRCKLSMLRRRHGIYCCHNRRRATFRLAYLRYVMTTPFARRRWMRACLRRANTIFAIVCRSSVGVSAINRADCHYVTSVLPGVPTARQRSWLSDRRQKHLPPARQVGASNNNRRTSIAASIDELST